MSCYLGPEPPALGSRSWMSEAACTGKPSGLFFPPAPSSPQASTPEAAYDAGKAVCRDCPVAPACLAYALAGEDATGEPWPGVWGGRTPRERGVIRRSRQKLAPAKV